MKIGKVYLTGGGCGDAGLLTLRALEVLRSCDIVVYDSLVSEELLKWTAPDCDKIYVGKRYGSHAMKQSEINALLVDKAQAGKTVVRLKGGDPYVFGRGGEEFLAVTGAGIECEEIPGISSAIAVPAAAGIPVTHRGLAAGVTIVTGTAATDGQEGLKLDFDTLARVEGTLVILMGMHHLKEIAEGLISAGKGKDTPCAVVMEGTTERQRCLRSTLDRIDAEVLEQGFTSPAVIVIGEVAGLNLTAKSDSRTEHDSVFAKKFPCAQFMENAGIVWEYSHEQVCKKKVSLAGISVGVTGTPHFVGKLSSALKEQGADVWDMGFLEIQPSETPLPNLKDYDWIIFTSPNGVRVFAEKMRQERKDLRIIGGRQFAVIGAGTAAALEEIGIYADYVPEVYDAVHLAEGLTERIIQEQRESSGGKICAVFMRAKQGSTALPRIFRERGISFLEYPLYDLGICKEKRAASVIREPDYIVFGSAMGVRAYFEGIEQAGHENRKSRYVCIGELCGEELKKHTACPFLTAQQSSVEAIVECLCRDAASSEEAE